MKQVTIDKTITIILYGFLLLLLFSTTNLIKSEMILASLGLIGLLVFLLIAIIKRKGVYLSQVKMYIPYLLFVSVYAVNILYNFEQSAFNNLVFYITYGLFLFVIISVKWKSFHLKMLSLISYIGLTILFYLLFIKVDDIINTNVIGIIAFTLSFFPIVSIIENKKYYKKTKLLFTILLFGSMIYFSGSRAVLLGALFMAITYLIWNFITKNKLLFKLYFVVISTVIFSYTVIYPNLHRLLTNFDYYQYLVIEYTGKSIYSGRNRIWEIILDKIYEKPFFGHGAQVLAGEFIETDQSSHNLYLEITLQVGIVGLLLFVLFLYQIWKMFWNNKNNQVVRLSASFFMAILIHQVNEVLLIKSAVSINFFIWMAFGIGLSHCFNKSPKQR